MGQPENLIRTLAEYEITVPKASILRHPCHQVESQDELVNLQVLPTTQRPLPVFETPWYLTNIGPQEKPLFLELRFATLSEETNEYVALLMTTERGYQIRDIAQRMIEVVEEAGIEFDTALGLPALGAPLAQAMSDLKGPDFYWTTCQKGRSDSPPPKPWLDPEIAYQYRSGTKPYEQVLYLDPEVFKFLKGRKIIITDDARLTGGSSEAIINFTKHQLGLDIRSMVSVLNEAKPASEIEGVPYFGLAKIPVFKLQKEQNGFVPIQGTFDGLDWFYLEK